MLAATLIQAGENPLACRPVAIFDRADTFLGGLFRELQQIVIRLLQIQLLRKRQDLNVD